MSLHSDVLNWLKQQSPHETEFLQAINEVSEHIVPIVNANDDYKKHNILQRLFTPQQIIQFAVEWEDDNHYCHVNTGWRVQHNNVLGPFKGGTRFHPSLNVSILKFLAFEQSFKNALTGLSLGAGKGGANFNPRDKSEHEVRRFCKAYMQSLSKYIGANTDVPAGDINVSDKEIGYMYGEYLRQTSNYSGALSGKPEALAGSKLRVEATGYGIMYFVEALLGKNDISVANKKVAVSGAGNVALHCAEKAIQMGASVLTLSNSKGTYICENSLSVDDINWLKTNKSQHDNPLEVLAQKTNARFDDTISPWQVESDLAIPCATQNEIEKNDAQDIISNVNIAVVEGANMPCTSEASKSLNNSELLYVPGKAANAGGVILSAYEMQQNAALRYEDTNDLDQRLQQSMHQIHNRCYRESQTLGNTKTNYSQGANVAGFRRIADAMVAVGY